MTDCIRALIRNLSLHISTVGDFVHNVEVHLRLFN